jgi:hypothetical protein
MTDDTRKPDDESPETQPAEKKKGGMPSAGPHADPRLMNPDATPGSGAIAPIGETDDANSQSTG